METAVSVSVQVLEGLPLPPTAALIPFPRRYPEAYSCPADPRAPGGSGLLFFMDALLLKGFWKPSKEEK